MVVSIHAPWEGCDSFIPQCLGGQATFQFTHPGKGATSFFRGLPGGKGVSIHAPWEGCDSALCALVKMRYSFNSRTLGRVRRELTFNGVLTCKFQFTHPGKGATKLVCTFCTVKTFQFTHPGKGATTSIALTSSRINGFNSRTLGRVRHPH